jgi:hypothetical protein
VCLTGDQYCSSSASTPRLVGSHARPRLGLDREPLAAAGRGRWLALWTLGCHAPTRAQWRTASHRSERPRRHRGSPSLRATIAHRSRDITVVTRSSTKGGRGQSAGPGARLSGGRERQCQGAGRQRGESTVRPSGGSRPVRRLGPRDVIGHSRTPPFPGAPMAQLIARRRPNPTMSKVPARFPERRPRSGRPACLAWRRHPEPGHRLQEERAAARASEVEADLAAGARRLLGGQAQGHRAAGGLGGHERTAGRHRLDHGGDLGL